jgi:hypothetical protein
VLLSSSGLDDLSSGAHLKLSAEDTVPEAVRNAETLLIVGKVVLEVVLLELLVIGREPIDISACAGIRYLDCSLSVVQKVMGHIVAGVAK